MKRYFKYKKNKPIFFILLISFVALVGGTIAYYTMTSNYENKFKASYYDVSIEEEFYNDWGTKKVSIVNNDSTPVVIRVNYNEQWSKNIEGELLVLNNKINGTDVVTKEWTDSWKNENYFVKGEDGWYYYKKVLKENERVQLLNSIELNENLIKENENYKYYKEYDYKLTFNYEAVQADSKAIKELWNKETSIIDNSVDWNI